MQQIALREEMQQIDAYSIQKIKIPGIVLMERAAMAMEEILCGRFPEKKSVLIVVERGNNGGDGLALCRLLMARGYAVSVYEIGGVKNPSESYQMQKEILERLHARFVDDILEETYDIWIDAIFGVGLKREVSGAQKKVIEKMNSSNGYKVAVDVPSGVDASTGAILGIGFQADLTITFGLSKVGLCLYPGAFYAGEVIVKDIGFPKEAINAVHPSVVCYTKEDLVRLPKRSAWSNKGNYGKVLVIAGAKNMAGAAFLCGKAAYKSGSGLVQIFTCEENRVILQSLLPEAILTTYDSKEDGVRKLKKCLSWATVIAIGPGMGQNAVTSTLLKEVFLEAKVPLVIDADAINCLSRERTEGTKQNIGSGVTLLEAYQEYAHGILLTPHIKEMSRFSGESVENIKKNIWMAARTFANQKHVVILKDARTIVSDGSIPTYINTSGNHGMSVGGSGDVLTGILSGMIAGGLPLLEAARMGVYIHGLAGDAAAREKGYYGLSAEDLIAFLYQVIH